MGLSDHLLRIQLLLFKVSELWTVLPVDCPVCLVPLHSIDGT